MKKIITLKPLCRLLKVCIVLSMIYTKINAQTKPPGFTLSTIGSGWTAPVGNTFNSSGTKLFVWEKGGKVFVCNWNPGTKIYDKQTTPVLDISDEVGNWRDHGLLGFALDPNYTTNGLIYLLYVVDRYHLMYYDSLSHGNTPNSYNAATNIYYNVTIGRITRYKTIISGPNLVADPATRAVLVGETKKSGFPILHESHGVGSLQFAADGTLLATCGDGASYNSTDIGNASETYYNQAILDSIIRPNENVGAFRSQMINSLNGKLIRIDPVTGNGISSNPFYRSDSPRLASSRVWAMGFRNPFRFTVKPGSGSLNPLTGDIGEVYIGDVGWNTFEELNIIKAPASNCGWPIFEGLKYLSSYANSITTNKDELNPLNGIGGCAQQYFTFQNLIKQATADNITTVYNPCNLSIPINSANNNRFFHRAPALDWKHGIDSARVKKFNGNILDVAQIGSAASGVSGTPFRGNCAAGSCWYTSDSFPANYKNTYFQADYGGKWIKKITMQSVDILQAVDTFSSGWAAIVCMAQNPMDGSLYCVDLGNSTVKRIKFGGNQNPFAVLSADNKYGTSPLTVNFTGSSSYDIDGTVSSYAWDFGDPTSGSNSSILDNPSHTFTVGNSLPKKYTIKLSVTDNSGSTSIDSIVISANNTPPVVNITSPIKNSFYTLGPNTLYALTATVTDAEHGSSQLFYKWESSLRHNNHQHNEPPDTNKITSALISRIGCNGDIYYWFIKLTVTDADGLITTDSSKIFPLCSGGALPVTLTSFSVTTLDKTNIINWITTSEINLKYFEVERSYDGINFKYIGVIPARRPQGQGNYEYRDNDHAAGFNYYRLKMIDIGGQFKYSPIALVYSGSYSGNALLVSPNPVRGNNFLVSTNFKEPEKITLRLININGCLIKTQTEQARTGFNSFTIENLSYLPQGIYIVELITEKEIIKTKLIKTN